MQLIETIDTVKVAACRSVFAEMSASWAAVSATSAAGERRRAEAQVFGQMVVALAGWLEPAIPTFGGTVIAKAANAPLQELNLLAHGIAAHQGRFPVDKTQIWRAEQSITGLQPGDRIEMTADRFARLCDACLDGLNA